MVPYILLALAQGAVGAVPATPASGPLRMTASEIRAYNAPLARNDPAYIRCSKQLNTGSLVRASTLCRTNEEWRRVEDVSNTEARDIVDRVNASGSTHGEEPAGSLMPSIGN